MSPFSAFSLELGKLWGCKSKLAPRDFWKPNLRTKVNFMAGYMKPRWSIHRANTCMDCMICMEIITYIKYIHNMTRLNFMKFHDTWYTCHDEPSRKDICKHLKSPSHSFTLFHTLLHIEALWVTGSWCALWPHSFCGWLHRHVMSASYKVLQSATGKGRLWNVYECLHRTC